MKYLIICIIMFNMGISLCQEEYYDIYRHINTSGGSPGNFSLISNVNQNTTSFSDIDLCGNGSWRVYYRLKAKNGEKTSEFSDYDDIFVQRGFCKKAEGKISENISHQNCNKLYQNFPNPFNSTTKVRLNVVEYSDIEIVVFDLLGHEVK